MEALRSTFGDAFTTLPLLIMGFVFFLGALTSNIGLLYLFLGHLLIVPAISYLGNENEDPLKSNGGLDPTKILKYVFSILVFLGINGAGIQAITGSSTSFLTFLGLLGCVFQIYKTGTGEKMALFDLVNIPYWRGVKNENVSSPACNIVPSGADDKIYNSPSHWVNHIVFFFGFIFSNTVAVYNEPTPPRVTTADSDADKQRNAQIDSRVSHRKSLAISIGVISTIVFFVILWFRYQKTGCEGPFSLAATPIIIAYCTGFGFFGFLYKSCGVRPADVLGIVQGMIASDLIDNPIVCVGTPT